jgi:hypothetical protein
MKPARRRQGSLFDFHLRLALRATRRSRFRCITQRTLIDSALLSLARDRRGNPAITSSTFQARCLTAWFACTLAPDLRITT